MEKILKIFFLIIIPLVLIAELIQIVRYFARGDFIGGAITIITLVVLAIASWYFFLRKKNKNSDSSPDNKQLK